MRQPRNRNTLRSWPFLGGAEYNPEQKPKRAYDTTPQTTSTIRFQPTHTDASHYRTCLASTTSSWASHITQRDFQTCPQRPLELFRNCGCQALGPMLPQDEQRLSENHLSAQSTDAHPWIAPIARLLLNANVLVIVHDASFSYSTKTREFGVPALPTVFQLLDLPMKPCARRF